jgi:hypothetical protein
MFHHLKPGEEVSFPGLLDIKLIVEEANNSGVRCKYFDDHLRKYIHVTFPADALIRVTPTLAPAPAVSVPPDPASDIC